MAASTCDTMGFGGRTDTHSFRSESINLECPGMTMTSRVEVRLHQVDLAGGGQTYSHILDYGGEVVNFTINKYIKCSIEQDSEGKKKIEYSSDVPTDLA